MPPSYTDEQIRELCARALVAKEREFAALISELKIALRSYTRGRPNLAVTMILQMPEPATAEEDLPEPEEERKDGT